MAAAAPSALAAGAFAAAAAWCAPGPAPHVPALARACGIARTLPLDGAVALTFDDGPHPQGTPAVLELLRARGAVATFFLVGEQVRRTGSLAGEILAAGHAVAIHGDTHRMLLTLTPRAQREDLDRAAETIGAGAIPVHRAPYGVWSAGALREDRRRGWTALLWSRWGRDWRARTDAHEIARLATRDLTAGDVVLLHDADDYSAPGSWRNTAAALPRILDAIEERGLRTALVRGNAHGGPPPALT
ncbi:MAG TPA: polysaccharide deacetylase family protein [Solirubrobacteraceae bacterium]|nr:polysaccharide deacetylase family protein [Solirubrobacteraceae bacterium]